MAQIAQWARGFSCPHEGLDFALTHEITTAYAGGYGAQFLDRFTPELERTSTGLVPLLESWVDSHKEFEDVWDTSVGYLRRAVLDDDRAGALQHASALALRLNSVGCHGEWEVKLDRPARLRLDSWLLPKAKSLRVTADGDRVAVSLGTNGSRRTSAELQRRGRGRGLVGRGADRLPSGRHYGCTLTLLESPALDGLHFGGEIALSRLTAAQILAKVRKSLKLLRDRAPLYLPWTQNVLRAVVPLHAQLSEIRSGSDFDKPGVVQASFPIRTIALAETWVHECSHQYFQIVTRVGPVDDGSDAELYYSPVRQTGRPIDKILLAYHAFANVLLFYRMCREVSPADERYLEINELRLIPQLRQLEEPLHRTRGLTDLGQAIWQPLAERVNLWD